MRATGPRVKGYAAARRRANSPSRGWLSLDLAKARVGCERVDADHRISCKKEKGKKEKEKGHHAVDASPLQPHLCDKDTARQVTAPVDQEPPEVLQVTGGLSGTIAAVLRFGRSVAGERHPGKATED